MPDGEAGVPEEVTKEQREGGAWDDWDSWDDWETAPGKAGKV